MLCTCGPAPRGKHNLMDLTHLWFPYVIYVTVGEEFLPTVPSIIAGFLVQPNFKSLIWKGCSCAGKSDIAMKHVILRWFSYSFHVQECTFALFMQSVLA